MYIIISDVTLENLKCRDEMDNGCFGVASPAENNGAFCLFRVCVSYLLKSNWTSFLLERER